MAVPKAAADLVQRLPTDDLAGLRDLCEAELQRREKTDSGVDDSQSKPVETEKCIDSLTPVLDPLFHDPIFAAAVSRRFNDE